MRIGQAQITRDDAHCTVQVSFTCQERSEVLWYRFPIEYEEYCETEKADAFVVALLLLAMNTHEDILVDGTMSERLYYNLTNHYMSIVRQQIPSLTNVSIVPAGFHTGMSANSMNMVGTGFSGGVDSFCCVADHLRDTVPASYRVSHLFFNNVGSHGRGPRASRLFRERYDLLKAFPKEMGIPFIPVDSNLASLFPFGFQLTHTIRNISVPLLFQKLLGRYLYASAYHYRNCKAGEAYDMAYSDPFAVHLLSTETLECISTGCQYSRVEKTAVVSRFEPSYRFLNVCTNPGKGGRNCSVCDKCCRTLLTLELLGALDKYWRVFDLEAWARHRPLYVCKVLLNDDGDIFLEEILRLADRIGHDLRGSIRAKYRWACAVLQRLPSRWRRAALKVRKALAS